MSSGAKKTEHAGPKKGSGAYWGRKVAAKNESNRKRRVADKKSVSDQTSDLEPAEENQCSKF